MNSRRGAEHRPVAPAELRHREGVGKAHQRADQPGQRDELEQLVGRVVKAGLRQLGRDDAPDQPDRKAEMLGHDRPDQVAPGDGLALRIPRIFRLPGSSRKSTCLACSSGVSLSREARSVRECGTGRRRPCRNRLVRVMPCAAAQPQWTALGPQTTSGRPRPPAVEDPVLGALPPVCTAVQGMTEQQQAPCQRKIGEMFRDSERLPVRRCPT